MLNSSEEGCVSVCIHVDVDVDVRVCVCSGGDGVVVQGVTSLLPRAMRKSSVRSRLKKNSAGCSPVSSLPLFSTALKTT